MGMLLEMKCSAVSGYPGRNMRSRVIIFGEWVCGGEATPIMNQAVPRRPRPTRHRPQNMAQSERRALTTRPRLRLCQWFRHQLGIWQATFSHAAYQKCREHRRATAADPECLWAKQLHCQAACRRANNLRGCGGG